MLDVPAPAVSAGKPEPHRTVRAWLYRLLEDGAGDHLGSRVVDALLLVLILANVAGFVLETVPSFALTWGAHLRWLETVSLTVFTIEYVGRLWAAPEIPFLARLPAWRARLHFASRWPMIIDLLAVLPFLLASLVSIDLRVLRVFRLFRVLKLNRYSPAMHTLMRVLINERRALSGALLLVLIALLFAASGMYLIEGPVQPDRFGSIPQAAWWAIVTLTTVGYGDVTPITPIGKVFAGIVMLCGLIVLALPIAIISTGFAQEVNRRDFVLTWSMLAKIPFFAELDAPAIGAMIGYLTAHTLPADREVVPRDPHGRSMFFVASGCIEEVTTGTQFRSGDTFGEGVLFGQALSAGTYVSRDTTRLLELTLSDFMRLQAHYPHLWKHVRSRSGRIQ